jgi:16S rRNA (guanine(966)-N(2))-methyltransferase RsmD
MRVIAGIYKSRLLKFPKNPSIEIRPTQDKVKQAMFEIIKADLVGADVLELFAGSGALGIEALSRGAGSVTFVDRERECIEVVHQNLDSLGIGAGAAVIKADIFRAIRDLSEQGARFGIIIADPPYGTDHIRKLLIKLDTYAILKKPFLIVIEHSRKDSVPQEEGSIILLKQYNYGDTVLSVYRKNKD